MKIILCSIITGTFILFAILVLTGVINPKWVKKTMDEMDGDSNEKK